ncbi:hypothetical protein ICE98_01200 [Lactococcus lactis]|nr:hypothetical protein [Lactococcus lactis]
MRKDVLNVNGTVKWFNMAQGYGFIIQRIAGLFAYLRLYKGMVLKVIMKAKGTFDVTMTARALASNIHKV